MAHKPTERVLHILLLLSGHPEGLSLTQIAEMLKIPKSTISPILQEMVSQNYLYIQARQGLYFIGITTKTVALSYDPQKEKMPFIKAEMQNITKQTGEICQLGTLEGADVLYLLKEEPPQVFGIQIISHVGKKLPAYCTALGKALLAELPLETIRALYPKGLIPQTAHTITDFKVLEEQRSEILKSGIAYDDEEITPYLCCYATSLHIAGSNTLALSISMPIFRAEEAKVRLVKELLLDAKKRIEAK